MTWKSITCPMCDLSTVLVFDAAHDARNDRCGTPVPHSSTLVEKCTNSYRSTEKYAQTTVGRSSALSYLIGMIGGIDLHAWCKWTRGGSAFHRTLSFSCLASSLECSRCSASGVPVLSYADIKKETEKNIRRCFLVAFAEGRCSMHE